MSADGAAGHPAPAPFAIAPDGTSMAAGDGPELLTWRIDGVPTWKVLTDGLLIGVAIGPEHVVTLDARGRLAWRRRTDGALVDEQAFARDVRGLALARDGVTAAVLTARGPLVVTPGTPPRLVPVDGATAVGFGPDGTALGVGTETGRFVAIEVASGAAWGEVQLDDAIGGVAWSAMGSWLVGAGRTLARVSGDGRQVQACVPSVELARAGGTPAPTEVAPAPTEMARAGGTPAPTEVAPAPTEMARAGGTPAPTEAAPAPTEMARAGGTPAPTEAAPAPTAFAMEQVACSDDGLVVAARANDRVELFELHGNRSIGELRLRRRIGAVCFGPGHLLGIGLDDGDASLVELGTGATFRTEPHPGRGRSTWRLENKLDPGAIRGALALRRAGGQPIARYVAPRDPDVAGGGGKGCLAGCTSALALVLVLSVLGVALLAAMYVLKTYGLWQLLPLR